MPDREYVACVQQDGRTFRSRPHPDRTAVERIAAEAGGWVEPVLPAADRAGHGVRPVRAVAGREPELSRAS